MSWIGILSTLAGLLTGGGVIAAWFKLGPERRKLKVETAQGEYTIISSDYRRVCAENDEMRMELVSLEQQLHFCGQHLEDLRLTCKTCQQDMALTRARAHLAINTMASYEIHIDLLLEEFRKRQIPITPMMRSSRIREAFLLEMNQLVALEQHTVAQTVLADEKIVSDTGGAKGDDKIEENEVSEPRRGTNDR